MGHQGAVITILKPMLNMLDANGFVPEDRSFVNNMHTGVKIMMYEGHDKYDPSTTHI
jgi:hypothetical protein